MWRVLGIFAIMLGVVTPVWADVVDLLRAGLAARNRGDPGSAIHYYSQAIETGQLPPPQLAIVLNGRGVAYDLIGDPDKAIADFDAAIRLQPSYAEAHTNRGLARVKKSEYDKAIEDFTWAIQFDQRMAFLNYSNRGGAYASKRQFDEALKDYDEAIGLNPEYVGAYYGKAKVYEALGDADRAIKEYDAAIRVDQNFSDAYNNRGVLQLGRGKFDSAIADFDAVIRLAPDAVLAHSNRAYVFAIRGQFDRAFQDFDDAVKQAPFNPVVYLNRGVALLYASHADVAARDFETATRLIPLNEYAIIWLHRARVQQGQDDRRELRQNASKAQLGSWPQLLAQLYLGSLGSDVISQSTLSGDDPKAQHQRACEIEFYLGLFERERWQMDGAEKRLRAAVDTCPLGSIERLAAPAELALLSRQ
ncbi:MAG: hypothetical protein C5B56_05125 [Proteobacteria bacterium]|nr:MAG: hypothetical protein C5B56_05125 [Pseudomonadota bacterium]